MKLLEWVRANLSRPGLVVGGLLLALSLTPSLIPRSALIQGLLSGCVFAAGYALGAVLEWCWNYLGLKLPGWLAPWVRGVSLIATVILVVICLSLNVRWQDTVRVAMGIEPASSGHVFLVVLVALLPALLLMIIGTALTVGVQRVAGLLRHALPPRVATLGGLLIVGVLTAMLFSGVLFRGALDIADEFFEQLDAVAGQFGDPAPADPTQSGSAQSLVAWNSIGRDGRRYVATVPTADQIEAVSGQPPLEPLRTYVGLRSAETPQARAALALAELQRIGAFDRSVLVVIMPVGTGWVDPPSIAAVEYLMNGDVASVSVQYSYLSSPLALIVEPDQGKDTAQALFDAVYGYWRTLPRDRRPRLFLNGLSLGANSSQASTVFLDVMANPFDGALWVGPPYTSTVWRWATVNRVAGSPSWRPVFGDSSSIRFANRGADLAKPDGPWGPMRIAFLQYPSDPIVFFDFATIFTRPSWMEGERGEGVSAELQWFPLVTFLQLAMDMAISNDSPLGYGHVYSTADYVDAWAALLEPAGWDAAKLDALKAAVGQYTGRD